MQEEKNQKKLRNVTYLQAQAGVNALYMHVLWSQGRFKIPHIPMQGLVPPQLGKDGEGTWTVSIHPGR